MFAQPGVKALQQGEIIGNVLKHAAAENEVHHSARIIPGDISGADLHPLQAETLKEISQVRGLLRILFDSLDVQGRRSPGEGIGMLSHAASCIECALHARAGGEQAAHRSGDIPFAQGGQMNKGESRPAQPEVAADQAGDLLGIHISFSSRQVRRPCPASSCPDESGLR